MTSDWSKRIESRKMHVTKELDTRPVDVASRLEKHFTVVAANYLFQFKGLLPLLINSELLTSRLLDIFRSQVLLKSFLKEYSECHSSHYARHYQNKVSICDSRVDGVWIFISL